MTELIFLGSSLTYFQVPENLLLIIVNGRGKTSFFKYTHVEKTSGRIHNARKNNRANKSLSEKAAYPFFKTKFDIFH